MRTLPVSLIASLIEWINKYSKNAKVLLTKHLPQFWFYVVEVGESLFFLRNYLLRGKGGVKRLRSGGQGQQYYTAY